MNFSAFSSFLHKIAFHRFKSHLKNLSFIFTFGFSAFQLKKSAEKQKHGLSLFPAESRPGCKKKSMLTHMGNAETGRAHVKMHTIGWVCRARARYGRHFPHPANERSEHERVSGAQRHRGAQMHKGTLGHPSQSKRPVHKLQIHPPVTALQLPMLFTTPPPVPDTPM
jgi:hypothetical protein